MRWMKHIWIFIAFVLLSSVVFADTAITDCKQYKGDEFAEATSSKDPIYLDFPDSIGLWETAKVTLYVNDPTIRKEAKYIQSGNAYTHIYTSAGQPKFGSSGRLNDAVPYDGSSTVSFGFRNLYDYDYYCDSAEDLDNDGKCTEHDRQLAFEQGILIKLN
jgi:hypothetical protein